MWFQLLRIPKKKRKHNIKKFKNDIDYDVLKNPNVSYCEDANELHYNLDPRLIVKYIVEDATNPTQLYTYILQDGMSVIGSEMFDKVEIDNVEVNISDLDTAEGKYQFSTTGEHVVKYTLKDPTFIGVETDGVQITNIGATFLQCTAITEVIIPNSLTSIGDYVFNACSSLTTVTIPDNITSIGGNAFSACSSLTSVTIPNSVTTIGYAAFSGCSGLTSITIPNGVTSIGQSAFSGCSGLTSITIPNSVTSIGTQSFSVCTSLTNVTIPDSVTFIDRDAFSDCTSLTSVTIPDSVTEIGYDSFRNCTSLTSITIPNSVTTIGEHAFQSCTGLTSVTIGSGVTTIGNSAFRNCSGLTSITSLATTAPTIESDTFRNVNISGTLTVPSGSTGYNVWMGTGNYYLGQSGWTKIEQ